MALSYSTTLRNSMLDAITSAVGTSALIKIYDGTRPANVGTAITTQTLLATLSCSTTFAPGSSGGVLTVNAITSANAVASSTATWFTITTSGGTRVVDGSIGTSGSDLNLTTTTIVSGQPVAISSFTITEGNP